MDTGRTCEDITADLAAVAAGPLPQPLSYLIADTARGHGRVRIAPPPASSTATSPHSWPNSPHTAGSPNSDYDGWHRPC
ncbi:helicase-associated domain-containing protein [Streptomyces sp. NPDC048142]|uniref:helicase-associated domain-containing protein n=1 Tax=Streptomyces sp. NPDC048142 TaxID=3365501 RepID=UPI003718052E